MDWLHPVSFEEPILRIKQVNMGNHFKILIANLHGLILITVSVTFFIKSANTQSVDKTSVLVAKVCYAHFSKIFYRLDRSK